MKIEIALAQIFSEVESRKTASRLESHGILACSCHSDRNCHTLTLAFADWQVNKNDLFFWQ